MKKRICLLSALSIVILMASFATLGFAQSELKKDWPKTFIFIAMKGGAGAVALGPGLTKELYEKHGVPGQVVLGGGPAAMLNNVAKGEAHMGAWANEPSWEAWNGIGIFKKQGRVTNIRKYLSIYPGCLHFMARADSGITKVEQWRGKRLMVDWPANPLQGMIGEALLESHGMTKKDTIWLKMTSGQEALDSLQTRKADVIVRLGPPGRHPKLKEFATMVDVKFLSFTEKEIKYVTEKLSFAWGPATFPAGSYKGQDSEVSTVGYTFMSVGAAELPDSFVYELMKLLFDDVGPDTPGHFTQYHKNFKWTLNYQMQNILELPWHNGCVKYFKDRGVWTDWMDKKQKALLAEIK